MACVRLRTSASSPPHFYLMPRLQQTPANIRINLFLLETWIPGLHSKFPLIFYNFRLIANISGTGQYIENQKDVQPRVIPPTFYEKSR